jgi:hypothetical protein
MCTPDQARWIAISRRLATYAEVVETLIDFAAQAL